MSEKEKLSLLEETLEMDEGTLDPDMDLDEIDEYDSLAKLSIVVMVEDRFNKKLKAADFIAFKKVSDILQIMED